jgi:hypothetical protein
MTDSLNAANSRSLDTDSRSQSAQPQARDATSIENSQAALVALARGGEVGAAEFQSRWNNIAATGRDDGNAESNGLLARTKYPDKKLTGLNEETQTNPLWARDIYKFGPNRSGENKIGGVGCTISATAMALGVTGTYVTPRDVNNSVDKPNNGVYAAAMAKANFIDLRTGKSNRGADPSGVTLANSAGGTRIEDDIKQCITDGKPVIIGITGAPKDATYSRHSLVACGIENGQIMVLDPAATNADGKALYRPLSEALTVYRCTKYDTAVAVSKK